MNAKERQRYMFNYRLRREEDDCLIQVERLSCIDLTDEWSYSFHKHVGIYEISCVTEGRGILEIPGTDTVCLKQGDIVIIPPEMMHRYSTKAPDTMRYYGVQVKAEQLGMPENVTFYQSITTPRILQGMDLRLEEQMLRSTGEHLKENGHRLDLLAQTMLLAYVSRVQELYRKNISSGITVEGGLAFDVLQYLEGNYTDHITRESLAETFHMSPSYLSAVFRRKYQIAPINYLIEKRMSIAATRLLTTDDTVVDIAQSVGYDNAAYFSRLFQKRTGSLPGEFREKNRH